MVIVDTSGALPLVKIRRLIAQRGTSKYLMTDSIDHNEPLVPPLEPILPRIGHFEDEPASESGRIEDLLVQIQHLDQELMRSREILEQERLHHATQAANAQLIADTRLDELRREELNRTQAMHESYRALLNERQLEFEAALSATVAAGAAQLEDEQHRHEKMLRQERDRHAKQEDAGQRREFAALSEQHERALNDLQRELEQAASSISRLQKALGAATERARRAEAENADLVLRLSALDVRLEQVTGSSDDEHQARVAELERRAEVAEERLATERRNAAATVAEVLAQSAAMAAETDSLRTTFAAELEETRSRSETETTHARETYVAQTAEALRSLEADRERMEFEMAVATQEADAAYRELAAAADEQAAVFLQRESELEALIGELRRRLTNDAGSP